MNILGNNSSKLNEVIFENRNKAYGAYAIREAYSDSLKKSILYLSSLVMLLFGSVFAYNKINAVPADEKGIVIDDSNIKPLIYETEVHMKPLETPVENTEVAATAPTGGMPLRIVDTETTNTVTANMNPVSGVGTETATGVAATGTETSTATATLSIAGTTASAPAETVVFADEMPEFEGGNAGLMQYVARNIVYPEVAKEVGAQGTVYVSFVVNEVGKVESAKVLKGMGLGCDEEVLRVINKMPQWKKPGKNAGHAVKVRFNIPVAFKLK
jgi:protein TonB